MDLALLQLKGDVIIRNDSGKTFGNIQHFNCIFRHTLVSLLFLFDRTLTFI